VDLIQQALAWDRASITGFAPTTGTEATAFEVPYDRTEVIYERNGVTIRLPVLRRDGGVHAAFLTVALSRIRAR